MITIYKNDTKGKVRIIQVETKGNILIQRSGILDGKLVENLKECKPKNIGKINETNGEEQAILEMNSFIKDKLTKGYFSNIVDLEKSNVILPMLAKDYKKEKSKISWGDETVFIQPKLDGMRCLAIKKGNNLQLLSRTGKTIDTVPHIIDELLSIDEDFILDGELYVHGENFQKNMTLIKKYTKGETEKVKFHFYDCIIQELSFDDRYMNNSMLNNKFNLEHTFGVFTTKINDEKGLELFHKQFLSEGYEGTIVRWGNAEYKINSRSSNLLKYKDFIDRTAIIVDVIPAENRPEQGILVCKFAENERGDEELGINTNSLFKSNLKFSHEERIMILKNKNEFIGKVAEIGFFEYTDLGLPRFPVCVGFRLDK